MHVHFIQYFSQSINEVLPFDYAKDEFYEPLITCNKDLMAYNNKIIHNPSNKQAIRFLQTAKDTDGKMLEIESTYEPYSIEPAQHYHPFQSEDFTVLEGELTIKLGSELLILKKGQSIHIPANKSHGMWNNSSTRTVVNWKVYPALETEYLLETVNGLASDGKVSAKGMPPLLQVVLTADKYASMFRLSKPAFGVQKFLFFILKPFAYIAGYKPDYAKYID